MSLNHSLSSLHLSLSFTSKDDKERLLYNPSSLMS
jgi:hypothetical protein